MWFFLVTNVYYVISNLRIVKKVMVIAEALKHSPWCFPATNEAYNLGIYGFVGSSSVKLSELKVCAV